MALAPNIVESNNNINYINFKNIQIDTISSLV